MNYVKFWNVCCLQHNSFIHLFTLILNLLMVFTPDIHMFNDLNYVFIFSWHMPLFHSILVLFSFSSPLSDMNFALSLHVFAACTFSRLVIIFACTEGLEPMVRGAQEHFVFSQSVCGMLGKVCWTSQLQKRLLWRNSFWPAMIKCSG